MSNTPPEGLSEHSVPIESAYERAERLLRISGSREIQVVTREGLKVTLSHRPKFRKPYLATLTRPKHIRNTQFEAEHPELEVQSVFFGAKLQTTYLLSGEPNAMSGPAIDTDEAELGHNPLLSGILDVIERKNIEEQDG